MSDLSRAPASRSLMAIKVDMERAYDRMSWSFIRRTLQEFGFHDTFIAWMMDCVQHPTFSILVNGSPTQSFRSAVGIRQGCPLSPYLFILCADALSRALRASVQDASLDPYWPRQDTLPLSHLLFADDCLLIGRASTRNASRFTGILRSYCRASGQLVNLQKSTVIFSPKTRGRTKHAIRSRLGIAEQEGMFTYLGIPMTGRKLRRAECTFLEHRIQDRIHGWHGATLSFMGRVTLIRSVLNSIPIYALACTILPSSSLRKIEQSFRVFLWKSGQASSGVHLIAWDTVCQPRRDGGLGIQSLLHRREVLLLRHAARFLLHPDCLWSRVMMARYGGWGQGPQTVPPTAASFIWKEIFARRHIVLERVRWLIGDGASVHVTHDAWISTTPISRWPTFVSMDTPDHLHVSDLLQPDSLGWRRQEVTRLFGDLLASRILSLPIPTSRSHDLRVWGQTCSTEAPSTLLSQLSALPAARSISAAWIWRVAAHPRVQSFLWKVVWDRLPTRLLLQTRGMDISSLCPMCGMEDETTAHAILRCPRALSIWTRVGVDTWGEPDDDWLGSFLHFIQHSSTPTGSTFLYLAYQIWLSRNTYVFEDVLTPPAHIIQRARLLAQEFAIFDAAPLSLDSLHHWDPRAAQSATRRVISIAWVPPPSGFVKVNFDGSVRGRSGGAAFVIRDSDGRLLLAGGSPLFDPSVPEAELRAAWAGITAATTHLHADRIWIEGDSATVISWILGGPGHGARHPLLHDIFCSLQSCSAITIRHIFRQANSAADWTAAFVADHTGSWTWEIGDPIPSTLYSILFLDVLGCPRTRVV